MSDSDFYSKAFHDIIERVFVIEMQSNLSLSEIKDVLRKHLPDHLLNAVSVNDANYKKTIDRLSNLLFTFLSLRAMGLFAFEEKIMDAEIKRLWNVDKPIKKGE